MVKNLLNLKWIKGDNIASFCGRYEMLVGMALSQGAQISEDMKICSIRNSLPTHVETTARMWTIADPEPRRQGFRFIDSASKPAYERGDR